MSSPESTPASTEVDASVDLARADVPFGGTDWCAALAVAETETAMEPHATAGEGGRYVTVEEPAVRRLLAPLGFTFADERGQVVATWRSPTNHGDGLVKVYTSIPAMGQVARDVGEDSMKVAALWQHTGDAEPRPLHKRLPYATRTRGWRAAILRRIAEVAPLLTVREVCRRCGAPTVERTGARGNFRGCVRFRECSGPLIRRGGLARHPETH